jgi:hypothetical protein
MTIAGDGAFGGPFVFQTGAATPADGYTVKRRETSPDGTASNQ